MNFKALAATALIFAAGVAAAPANANPSDWHCDTQMGWETCMNFNLNNDKVATDLEITGPNGEMADVEIACSGGQPFIFTSSAPHYWGQAHADAFCQASGL